MPLSVAGRTTMTLSGRDPDHAAWRVVRLDPGQAGRLADITPNLEAQVHEAQRGKWPSNVAGCD